MAPVLLARPPGGVMPGHYCRPDSRLKGDEMYYAIQATVVEITPEGGAISRQVPTFYLHDAVQGITSVKHAEVIARDVVDRAGSASEVHVTATPIGAAPDQHDALKGCRDMLRESAKQFRLLGDDGHAVVADRHADAAAAAIRKATGGGD